MGEKVKMDLVLPSVIAKENGAVPNRHYHVLEKEVQIYHLIQLAHYYAFTNEAGLAQTCIMLALRMHHDEEIFALMNKIPNKMFTRDPTDVQVRNWLKMILDKRTWKLAINQIHYYLRNEKIYAGCRYPEVNVKQQEYYTLKGTVENVEGFWVRNSTIRYNKWYPKPESF